MGAIDPHIVVVGAGHAGGRAVEALRAAGFAGQITLIGEEDYPPYERPPLSKELLAGAIPVEKAFIRPPGWYAEQRIELRRGGRAEAIERRAARLHLADGTRLSYGRLLLTTGARPRRLAVAGAHGPRIHYIRAIPDTLALRARLEDGARLAVIGGGFIGLEVAAVARRRGCTVTVIELAPHLLSRVVAPEIGDWFARLHRGHGVEVRTGIRVTEIEDDGRQAVIFTADGERIAADAVAIGVGAVPNTELAEAAGLEVDDGIVVDEFGRTSDPAIFAAGDATRHFNPLLGRHVRLEAWQNAQNQAIAVAKVLAGAGAPYAELPWFWTDQYDLNFQAAGAPLAWDRLVWRGSPEENRFVVFYLQDGRPVGANAVNSAREMRFVKQIVAKAEPVDAGRLGDPAVKLAELCR
jgi:NADPH-dependent 2,4-dienoyl-CoA reductase/sulfur reductase-like enzyme